MKDDQMAGTGKREYSGLGTNQKVILDELIVKYLVLKYHKFYYL